MLCWALEPHGLFFFMLCPFLQFLACYLPPVPSFLVALCGRVSVRMRCLTTTHMGTEWRRLVTPERCFPVFLSRFLFRDRWEQRVCFLAVNKKKNGRRLRNIGYVHLFLVTSGNWNGGIKSVRGKSTCFWVPSDLKKAVEPTLQCHHGGEKEGSTNVLNEEDYLNGKLYYWGLARMQAFCFTIKSRFDFWFCSILEKNKPFHCWKRNTHNVESILDSQ